MFQKVKKGYVEQQIEQLTLFLINAFPTNISEESVATKTEIAKASQTYCGMSIGIMSALPLETVLGMFEMGGTFDAGRCYMSGMLLDEQARILESEGKSAGAQQTSIKSLFLLAIAVVREDKLQKFLYTHRIDEIRTRLNGNELPPLVLKTITDLDALHFGAGETSAESL